MRTIKFPLNQNSPHIPPSPGIKAETENKVDTLVRESHEVIYKTTNIFPFDFFPDEIIVTRNKVDLVYGLFFFSKEVFPIMIPNIYSITVDHDLFFASIDFKLIGFSENPTKIKFLKKADAIK